MTAPAASDDVLVDTDVFSFLMKSQDTRRTLYEPHVKGKRMCVSFVTVAELHYWAHARNWGQRKVDDLKSRLRSVVIVPFDQKLCVTYAELKAKTSAVGVTVAANDLWIAACAVRHALPLISHNRKHFENIPGLVLISEPETAKGIPSQQNLLPESKATSEISSEPGPPASQ